MAAEFRDPAMKLFGWTIALPEDQRRPPAAAELPVSPIVSPPPPPPPPHGGKKDNCNEQKNVEPSHPMLLSVDEISQSKLEKSSAMAKKGIPDGRDAPIPDGKDSDSVGQDQALKKPDKVLPCPRCNSMDTKFCYYNNYNVNQPRHFCKNCQRYWTAGGTMRNVPVGAGRRKNKHSPSAVRANVLDPSSNHGPLPCGLPSPVLKFGPELPLCESLESVLSLGEPRRTRELGPFSGGESTEEPSCASSVTAASDGVENAAHRDDNGMQCSYPAGHPWAWSSGWNNLAVRSPMVAPPPLFFAPAIPMPLVSASLWGCMPGWIGGSGAPWHAAWMAANGVGGGGNGVCSGGGDSFQVLGKHSREDEEKAEKSLWMPKTLRIDDPAGDAVKSSFWDTLGINPEEGGGAFGAFRRSKAIAGDDGGKPPPATPPEVAAAQKVLHANPAAVSRSQTFHESA